jgi:hypothetical protein
VLEDDPGRADTQILAHLRSEGVDALSVGALDI